MIYEQNKLRQVFIVIESRADCRIIDDTNQMLMGKQANNVLNECRDEQLIMYWMKAIITRDLDD